ncbi:MAG: hypothetical protein GXP25_13050 [Planctomycetes bacterium]|nr:hypothetical protein [Planctomycetota bacterium]
MTGNDAAKYMANLLYVAQLDGALNAKEGAGLDAIRAAIGVTQKDMGDATALLAEKNYQPTPAGRFSDQVRNLEDMIQLAVADGKMVHGEKKAIVAFATRVGVTQEQIDRILRQFCPRQESAAGGKGAAPSKETPARRSAAKFSVFHLPTGEVCIEFAESEAFGRARNMAANAPVFKEVLRSGRKWVVASWPMDQMLEAARVAEQLKGVEERKALVAGEDIDWDELFGFLPCLAQREGAYLAQEHCFSAEKGEVNIWGCKSARMNWAEFSPWFTYGTFKKKDVFAFDKERIKGELERNLRNVRFCPFLRADLLKAVLDLLPDEVQVSRQSGWKYRGNEQETPNSIPLTIREMTPDGPGAERKIYARGVSPIGFDAARDLLMQAFTMCRITDVDYRALAP